MDVKQEGTELFFLACPGLTAEAQGQQNLSSFAWSVHSSLEWKSTGTFLHLGVTINKSLLYLIFLIHKPNFTKTLIALTLPCRHVSWRGKRQVSVGSGQPMTKLYTHMLPHSPGNDVSAWLGLQWNKIFLCLLHLNTYIADQTPAFWGQVNTMIKQTGLGIRQTGLDSVLALCLNVAWQWVSYLYSLGANNSKWVQIRLFKQCLGHGKNWKNYCYSSSSTLKWTLISNPSYPLKAKLWGLNKTCEMFISVSGQEEVLNNGS